MIDITIETDTYKKMTELMEEHNLVNSTHVIEYLMLKLKCSQHNQ